MPMGPIPALPYYCPLKSNRQVDASNAQLPYQRGDSLQWSGTELHHGKRIIRNHIGCVMLVWVRLKTIAYQTDQTIYQVKNGLFSQYLTHQLKAPDIHMKLA